MLSSLGVHPPFRSPNTFQAHNTNLAWAYTRSPESCHFGLAWLGCMCPIWTVIRDASPISSQPCMKLPHGIVCAPSTTDRFLLANEGVL